MIDVSNIDTTQQLVKLLGITDKNDLKALFELADSINYSTSNNNVYVRGLIEISNRCSKNCFYCGIRCGNEKVVRYDIPAEEVLKTAQFALDNKLSSLVIQSGERSDKDFVLMMDEIIKQIMHISDDKMAITLSCGEQSLETYQRWFESGAKRYLLRIETTNQNLYEQIHPKDKNHSFGKRLKCIEYIQRTGYQTGTGVMIGIPGQTLQDLAEDLLFIKDFDIDMVGMGPYLTHDETPMASRESELLPINERLSLALKMVAVLRILMPDINIAASTALQAIHPDGRMMALNCGANVIMPNITEKKYTNNYFLYDKKPGTTANPSEKLNSILQQIIDNNRNPVMIVPGHSAHFAKRIRKIFVSH
jgi:biotin synthase